MIIEGLEKITSLPTPALGLLRAIHDSTVTSYTSGALPAVSAGQVFKNNSGAPVTLPAFGPWPAQRVQAGEHAGCDGRFWYPVVQRSGTNSFYPAVFERHLYSLAFTAQSLPLETTFSLDREISARLLNNNCDAVWRLVWEIGMRVDTATPSPIGPNIQGYEFRTPLIDEELTLTDVAARHAFGVSLRRKLDGTDEVWTGTVTRYGRALAAVAAQLPTGNSFILRLRLACFDITDETAEPRGYAAFFISAPKKEQE